MRRVATRTAKPVESQKSTRLMSTTIRRQPSVTSRWRRSRSAETPLMSTSPATWTTVQPYRSP